MSTAVGVLTLAVVFLTVMTITFSKENERLRQSNATLTEKHEKFEVQTQDLRNKYDEVLDLYEGQTESLNEMQTQVDTLTERNNKLKESLNATKDELKKAKQTASVSRGTSVSSRSNTNTPKANSGGTGTPVGTFNASYYGMDCVGCSGRTASGFNTKGRTHYNGLRILAGDTSILPLGTIVYVEGSAIGSFKGIVLDRGGAIKGNKLDILVGSEAESSGLGRQNVKVNVISYGDNRYRKID